MAQPHDQHRHRLRLRRQADRAALSRARAGLGAGARGCTTSRSSRSRAASRPTLSSAAYDDLLDIDDVLGKRIVTTRLHHTVTMREENAAAALEVMSRFAVDPRWLIYLPPTMSPPETMQGRASCSSIPPRRSPTFRTEGVDRGRLRGEAHGLARGRRRLPRRSRRGASASASAGEPGVMLHADRAAASSPTARSKPTCSSASRGARRRGTVGRARDRLGLPRLPSSCRGRPRRRSCCAEQYAAVGAAAAPALWPAAIGALDPRGARGADGACAASTAYRARSERGRSLRRRPTGAIAGPSSSVDDLQHRAVPPARERRRRSTSIAITSGTWRRSRGCAAADPAAV